MVDLVCQQAESQVVSYIELSLCTSRETEITHRKKETQVSIDNSGLIKLTKQDREVKTEVTGDLKVRQCMQRRAVAYHLANIATYKTLEKFTAKLFHYLTKEPVASHRPISLQQIIQADRELWIQVSQTTRGKILTSNPKPIDEAVAKLSESTEVLYHLMPLPRAVSLGLPTSRRPTDPAVPGALRARATRTKEREVAKVLNRIYRPIVSRKMIRAGTYVLHINGASANILGLDAVVACTCVGRQSAMDHIRIHLAPVRSSD